MGVFFFANLCLPIYLISRNSVFIFASINFLLLRDQLDKVLVCYITPLGSEGSCDGFRDQYMHSSHKHNACLVLHM
jgi:hypothetical protein